MAEGRCLRITLPSPRTWLESWTYQRRCRRRQLLLVPMDERAPSCTTNHGGNRDKKTKSVSPSRKSAATDARQRQTVPQEKLQDVRWSRNAGQTQDDIKRAALTKWGSIQAILLFKFALAHIRPHIHIIHTGVSQRLPCGSPSSAVGGVAGRALCGGAPSEPSDCCTTRVAGLSTCRTRHSDPHDRTTNCAERAR